MYYCYLLKIYRYAEVSANKMILFNKVVCHFFHCRQQSAIRLEGLIANCRWQWKKLEKHPCWKESSYWQTLQHIYRSSIGNNSAIIDQLIITIFITIFLYSSKKRKSLIIYLHCPILVVLMTTDHKNYIRIRYESHNSTTQEFILPCIMY